MGQRLPPDDHERRAHRKRFFNERLEDPRSCKHRSASRCFPGTWGRAGKPQFSEVYTALQTKVVDARENPLPIIQVAKLYEVQSSCALTNHIWDGYWFIANGRQWSGMPADVQEIVSRAINEAGLKQRGDIKALNKSVQADLQSKGLKFNQCDTDSFRAKLREAGFSPSGSRSSGPKPGVTSRASSERWHNIARPGAYFVGPQTSLARCLQPRASAQIQRYIMSRFLGEIRQAGYVVDDIEAAMDYWSRVLGVGPFFYKERVPDRELHLPRRRSIPAAQLGRARQFGAIADRAHSDP